MGNIIPGCGIAVKILFAIKKLDNAPGGAERVLCDIASALSARGHDVSIISFDLPGGASFYPLSPSVRRINLQIGDAGRPTGWLDGLRRVRGLRRYLKAHTPNVAIGFMHSMFIPLAIAAWGMRIPVVASEHIAPTHYSGRPLQRFAWWISFLMIKRMTILSDGVAALYPRILRRKMVVVPNPVRVVRAAPDPAMSHQILAIGRFEPQKAHDVLIDAFARLAADFPAWRLDIVGAGALENILRARIDHHALSSRIGLHAPVQDIDSFYERAAIFATAARYEGFGLAVAEAMYCGLPVVGFADCPGVNELVADGENGLLSAPGADELANALRRLMGDAQMRTRMGQAGRARAASYSVARACGAWEKLLHDIAA